MLPSKDSLDVFFQDYLAYLQNFDLKLMRIFHMALVDLGSYPSTWNNQDLSKQNLLFQK
jgi:hypothetical protein